MTSGLESGARVILNKCISLACFGLDLMRNYRYIPRVTVPVAILASLLAPSTRASPVPLLCLSCASPVPLLFLSRARLPALVLWCSIRHTHAHAHVQHGMEDEIVPIENGRNLHKACQRAVEPLWLPGVG